MPDQQNGEYQVTNVQIRQSPQLGPGGKAQMTTILSFQVGPHGPFTVVWQDQKPTQADFLNAIAAQVNQIASTAKAVAQLNQTTPVGY